MKAEVALKQMKPMLNQTDISRREYEEANGSVLLTLSNFHEQKVKNKTEKYKQTIYYCTSKSEMGRRISRSNPLCIREL